MNAGMNAIKHDTMNRVYLIFCIIWCAGLPLSGQSFVLTVLDDRNDEPVVHASIVYTYEAGETRKKGYEFTDQEGRANLTVPGEAELLQIEVFQLSYEPAEQTIDLREVKSDTIIIRLSPRIHEIQEIQVRGESVYAEPIPDTLTYSVDSFATLSTPGILDVLERIEGIRITGNRISFRGRFVSRVFLDGVDLASDSYMTMVEAVNTSLIEEIDIISNHHSNPVMAKFEPSELVLDLRTKGSSRMKFSGRGSAGASTRELLTLTGDVTGVSPGLKSMARFTNNRMSARIYLPAEDFSHFNPLRMPMGGLNRNYETQMNFAPMSSKSYTTDQKILGSALLLGIPAGKNWTIRSTSYFQQSELTHFHSLSTLNFLPDTTFTYGFENHTLSDQHFFRTELESEYSTENSYLNIELTADLPYQTAKNQQYYSGQITDTLSDVLKLRDAYNFSPTLTFSRKMGDAALDYRHEFQYTRFSEVWENANRRTANLRNKEGVFQDQVHTTQFKSTGELLLNQDWSEHRIGIGLGHQFLRNQKELNTHISGQEAGNHHISNSDFAAHTLYGAFQLEKGTQHTPMSYRGSVNLGISSNKWLQTESTYHRELNPYLTVDLELDRKLNRWSGVVLNYSFENRPISPRYVVPDSILTPHYRFLKAYQGSGSERSHQWNAKYVNKRIDRLFNYDLGLRFTYRPNTVIPNMMYFLTHQIATYRSNKSRNLTLDFNWQQDFIHSDWSLSGKLSFSGNNYSRNLNHREVTSSFRSYSNQLDATYRKGGFELILSGRLRYLIISSDPGFQKSDSWYWNNRAEINYLTRNERIRVGLTGEHFHYGASESSFIALDFKGDFYVSKKLKLQLLGHNLLNNKNFILRRFSPEFESNQIFQLRPRYVGIIATLWF
nr:hypothetical protein [Saprospiraceae bacterium]